MARLDRTAEVVAVVGVVVAVALGFPRAGLAALEAQAATAVQATSAWSTRA
jgi:hypothetical protein